MPVNLSVHTSRGSKNSPKWLYLMNEFTNIKKIHIEGNKDIF